MADRRIFGKGQVVLATELNAAFDGAEGASQVLADDLSFFGIINGFSVSEQGPQAMAVDVTAGLAYDDIGQRCAIDTLTALDLSVDLDDNDTTVLTVGNEKWLTILLRFVRSSSDQRTVAPPDGDGVPYFHISGESAEIVVRQGTEASTGTATKPAAGTNELIVADTLIVFGQTVVIDAGLDLARRDVFVGFAGGGENLSATLGIGNTTGGVDLVVSDGDTILAASAADLDLAAGVAGGATSAGQSINLLASNGGATSGNGGDIVLTPGTAPGAGTDGEARVAGNLNVTGKLTVAGLIDPTGLILTEASAPSTAVNEGAIYVKTDNELYYRKESDGTETQISGGGGGFSRYKETIALHEQVTGTTTPKVAGEVEFNPNDWSPLTTVRFGAMLTSDGTLTARAKLFKWVSATGWVQITGTTLTTTSADPVRSVSSNLTIGTGNAEIQNGAGIYRVQIETTGTIGSEIGFVGSAWLEMS